MKILIVIYNYAAGFPFVQELEQQLKAVPGYEVDVLDSDLLFVKEHNGNMKKLLPAMVPARLLSVQKLGTFLKLFVLRRYLAGIRGKYDVVNVHSCDPIYIYLAKQLKHAATSFYAMVWGSDFHRAPEEMRKRKRAIFDNCRQIVFANPVFAADFTSYYNDYTDKAVIASFGIGKLDTMGRLLETYSRSEFRREFGLPEGLITVAIGYNGVRGQQHVKLLEEFRNLAPDVRSRIFIVLQMTYGADPAYASEVDAAARAAGIPYKIFLDRLDDDQAARMRLAIDVVLNGQITDGFSASIQEHIYAGAQVIVGDWLPYKPLEQAGILYYKEPLKRFGAAVEDAVRHYGERMPALLGNAGKIYAMSGWKYRIKNWKDIFEGRGTEYLFQKNKQQLNKNTL